MDNILKIVLLGAAVMLTIGVIAVGIFLFNSGQQVVAKSEQEMASISNALSMKKYEMFDNTLVTGSQAISSIRMYAEQGTLSVVVKTLGGAETTYNTTTKYTITDPTNVNYINPTGQFNATLTINANKVPTAVSFVQK